MALTPVRIPQLQQREPIVDKDGRMSNEFARRLGEILQSLAVTLNAIAALPEIQKALEDAQSLIENLGDATKDAQDAAAAANAQAEATKREAALQGSYIDPDTVLSASPTLITIAPHTRNYADGTSAAVNGGTAPATAANDVDYVSYSDPTRKGGTVTYIVSTTPPVQTGDTHVVGAVQIPATGTVDGGEGPRRPGYVSPRLQEKLPEE
jgi:hypothetical protein